MFFSPMKKGLINDYSIRYTIRDSVMIRREYSGQHGSRRYNPYAAAGHRDRVKSRRETMHERFAPHMKKIKMIQKFARWITKTKKNAVNSSCPYTMEETRLRGSIRIYDNDALYLINAELLSDYFLQNYVLNNPFTLRALNSVEFNRIAKHPNNMHVKPLLVNSWKDREYLRNMLLEKNNLITAFTEDLENIVEDSVYLSNNRPIADVISHIMDTMPYHVSQVLNDFVNTDIDELISVLREIIRRLRTERMCNPIYQHMISRYFVNVLDTFE